MRMMDQQKNRGLKLSTLPPIILYPLRAHLEARPLLSQPPSCVELAPAVPATSGYVVDGLMPRAVELFLPPMHA